MGDDVAVQCSVCGTACPVPTSVEPAETLDEELKRLLGGLSDLADSDCHEAWPDTRDALLGIHEVYDAECGPSRHPAIVAQCVLRMEGLAHDLADLASADNGGPCRDIHCLTEFVLADVEDRRFWEWDNEELKAPPSYPQREGARFAECESWDMPTAGEKLSALAELIAQCFATESEGAMWRDARDRFLRYYNGYRTPGLHPAVARHYARSMSDLMGVMCRYRSRGEDADKLHDLAESLLWMVVDDATEEMYGHDATDMEMVSPHEH